MGLRGLTSPFRAVSNTAVLTCCYLTDICLFFYPAVPRLRDEGNETIIGCRSPNVRDIDTSRDTVSGVRNGTEYINVTLHWRYDPASMDNWCSASVFGVRYVTWDNVYDLPPFIKDPQVNAYERYEFDWEPWEVIPQGNHSVTIPFLRKDLYYLFQVAVPQSNLNVHTVWFSKNANRYSSRVTYYGEQSEWRVK